MTSMLPPINQPAFIGCPRRSTSAGSEVAVASASFVASELFNPMMTSAEVSRIKPNKTATTHFQFRPNQELRAMLPAMPARLAHSAEHRSSPRGQQTVNGGVLNRFGGNDRAQRVPWGKPWDRQPISGKLRRKFGVSPGFAAYFGTPPPKTVKHPRLRDTTDT